MSGYPLLPHLGERPLDRTALAFPDRSLSYAELLAAASGAAAAIRGAQRVAVVAHPCIETCVAVVGTLLAGIPAVLINPNSGTQELAHIVRDAQPDAILTATGTAAPGDLRDSLAFEIDLDARGAAPLALDEPSAETPALIIYTSGTTGPPKGVVLPRRSLATNIDALAAAWRWTGVDVVAHSLPLFHVHGMVLGTIGPLRLGGLSRHLGKFSPDAVERALLGDTTMLFGVPTMYRRLAEAAERSPSLVRGLSSARLLVSGSAPLPVSEHARIQRLTGRRVIERYGMTETLMNTAVRVDDSKPAGSVGPPLAGVDVRLIDDAGNPLTEADGTTIGEIEVRGPNLFLGYLNRPDATAAALDGGWFRTGDLATQGSGGELRIVGRRATDLIKSGGFKIGAGEIEGCLLDHAAVDAAAVTAAPDADLGERVVAWVVLREGSSASAQELIDHVARTLAPHKRPRVVHFLDELPRNELGKVQKSRLAVADMMSTPRAER